MKRDLSPSDSDSDAAGEPPSKLTRVDDLWFPKDSTLVLRAENVIFQVSGTVLAARSPVFRDMMALPQPAQEEMEQIDGCPLVRLPESACDVEIFLRAIFDTSYFMPHPANMDHSAVLAILRMSHKYDINYLHRRALHHLGENGWYLPKHGDVGSLHLSNIPRSPEGPIAVILAAQQVGAMWLLPYAYYCLATCTQDELHHFPCTTDAERELVDIALAAQVGLLRGTLAINRFLTEGSTCSSRTRCDTIRRQCFSSLMDRIEDGGGLHARDVEPALEALQRTRMCLVCLNMARLCYLQAVERFWLGVPSLFGLQPWSDLADMRGVAFGEEPDDDFTLFGTSPPC